MIDTIVVQAGIFPPISDIVSSIVAKGLVVLFIIILSWIYRAKVKEMVFRVAYYLSNEEILLQISRIDRYPNEPTGYLDHNTFQRLQAEHSGDVYQPEISDERLVVSVENIPSKIVIRIDEDFDFTEGNSSNHGYKLVIETDRSLRFGYRDYDSLQEFKNFSETAANAMRATYFEGDTPNQSFLLGEMSSGVPGDDVEIEDDKLQISAYTDDSSMKFVFENPKNLIRGVRKYFKPQLNVVG